MLYFPGVTLRQLLTKALLEPENIRSVAYQIDSTFSIITLFTVFIQSFHW